MPWQNAMSSGFILRSLLFSLQVVNIENMLLKLAAAPNLKILRQRELPGKKPEAPSEHRSNQQYVLVE